jgi:hypothetical protein
MNVIVCAPNGECLHPMFSGDSSDVGPQTGLGFLVYGLPAFLCREDAVK